MTKPLPKTTLDRLDARLHEHALEVATLQLALDIQATRIAEMQAGRHLPRHASKHPQSPRARLTQTVTRR